jgi:hypothetical protein
VQVLRESEGDMCRVNEGYERVRTRRRLECEKECVCEESVRREGVCCEGECMEVRECSGAG